MNIKESRERFHQDGFLVIPSVLSSTEIEQLKFDLDQKLKQKDRVKSRKIMKRMFETSTANLELFWKEPIVSFAEQLIADNGSISVDSYSKGIPSANETHVIHNNSFKILSGQEGLGGSGWHQDDTPHLISLDGKPLTNVKLPVLAFTCLYYLTDVLTVENGPTQIIPGSHLFGKHCDGNITGLENKIVSALGPAGTVVMFNNQVWHRGSKNQSDLTRIVTQVTYAKRLVGHKYSPFINYQLPQHVIAHVGDDKRKKRLIGFLSGGAYG
jgi:hypothetical protein